MVSDHETVFILCSSSLLTKVVGSVVGLFLIMYPLTTHKQEGSKKQSFPIYNSSNYLVVKYVPIISYLSTHILDLLLPDWVIKVNLISI
jgi:hypothetical protein